jgi:hypothetical protein
MRGRAWQQEADAEVGTNDLGVVVDEGFALVGVEFEGQAAPQNGLLEGVEERGGVGVCVVAGKDNESAVVVNNEAEVGGDDFAVVSAKSRPAGEIDHPQIVGRGGFEGFGRTVLESPGLEAAGVEAVGAKEAPNGALTGQHASMVLPAAIEDAQGHAGTLADGFDDPEAQFLIEGSAFSGVPALGFAGDAREADFGVVIPPGLLLRSFTEVPLASEGAPARVFQRAGGKIPPTLRWPGTQGSGPHAFNEREAFSAEGFDVADDLVPQKREGFFRCGCRFFHDGSVLSRHGRCSNKRGLWGGGPRFQTSPARAFSRSQCGSRLR